MFEDELAALTPRSASVFERELRRLLDSYAPQARRPGVLVVELAEDFDDHGRGWAQFGRPAGPGTHHGS